MKRKIDKVCFLCNDTLTQDNKSNEHIIKNSIGGRRKVKNFICDNCNNETGHTWDKDIDTYLGEFSALLFDIKRQNGKIPSKHILDSNTSIKYQWSATNLIQITPTHTFDGKTLKIMAKDKQSIQQYESKLKRENKIPTNATSSKEKVKKETSSIAIKTLLKFEIPDSKSNFSKSVVKSALALLSDHNYSTLQTCKLAKNFLSTANPSILRFYYSHDPIINRPFATPLHTVYIFNEESNLYAYIELFSTARYKIHLSDCYNDKENISIQYSIDPTTATELNLNFDFDFDHSEEIYPALIQKNLIKEMNFSKYVKEHFNKCLEKSIKRPNFSLETIKNDIFNCYFEILDKKNIRYQDYAQKQYFNLLQNFLESINS